MSAPFAIARSLQTKVCCDITESTQEKSLLPVECVGFVSMTAQVCNGMRDFILERNRSHVAIADSNSTTAPTGDGIS